MKTVLALLALLAQLVPASFVLAQPTPIPTDIPEGVDLSGNIVYARYGDRDLLLDLYRPAGATEALPAVVVIRGGGWAAGDKEGFGPMAAALATRGFIAVSIEYRAVPEATYPAAVFDAKAAVRWLRANAAQYNIAADAIGVIGGSAGAHIATYLGVTAGMNELEGNGGNEDHASTVQAVVGLAAPTSLMPDGGCPQTPDPGNAVPAFLGADCAGNEGLWAFASPVSHVTENAAPVLLIHSEKDNVVDYSQSLLLALAYGRRNVPVTVQLFPDAPHAFWNFTEWFEATMDTSASFFHRHLDK